MPGLLRGMARTAAIVGTAEATRNVVDRRQADKQMKAYSNAAANAGMTTQPQQAPPAQGYYAAPPPPPQYAPPPPAPAPDAAPPQDDLAAQIQRLSSLHQQGVLTDDEYAAAKQKLLMS